MSIRDGYRQAAIDKADEFDGPLVGYWEMTQEEALQVVDAAVSEFARQVVEKLREQASDWRTHNLYCNGLRSAASEIERLAGDSE